MMVRCSSVPVVVAAMNGSAVGVGLTMVLPADMRIIAETAKVALPFVKRGITLEAMSSYFLPRLVGHASEFGRKDRLASSLLCLSLTLKVFFAFRGTPRQQTR